MCHSTFVKSINLFTLFIVLRILIYHNMVVLSFFQMLNDIVVFEQLEYCIFLTLKAIVLPHNQLERSLIWAYMFRIVK